MMASSLRPPSGLKHTAAHKQLCSGKQRAWRQVSAELWEYLDAITLWLALTGCCFCHAGIASTNEEQPFCLQCLCVRRSL